MLDSMTVSAKNFTLRYFTLDVVNRTASAKHTGNVDFFFCTVTVMKF